jgi:cell division protein FtsB
VTAKLTAAMAAVPFAALLLSACVSEKSYEAQTQQLQQARAQSAAEQAQIAKMQQEDKFVVAGDVLFPEGGY